MKLENMFFFQNINLKVKRLFLCKIYTYVTIL